MTYVQDPFGSFANSDIARLSLAYGRSVVNKNIGVLSFFSLDRFRIYFDVTNNYVLNKILLIIFPFQSISTTNYQRDQSVSTTNYQRSHHPIPINPIPTQNLNTMNIPTQNLNTMNSNLSVQPNISGIDHSPTLTHPYHDKKSPREDLNAPDLYIPLMSFITFILLVAFFTGIRGKFSPELLGLTTWAALVIEVIEIIIMRFGFYMFSTGHYEAPPLIDLLAYSGYKYIHVIITILLGVVFGYWIFVFSSLVFGIIFGVFLARSLRFAFFKNQDFPSDRKQTHYIFLLLLGMGQTILIWYLGRRAFVFSQNVPRQYRR